MQRATHLLEFTEGVYSDHCAKDTMNQHSLCRINNNNNPNASH